MCVRCLNVPLRDGIKDAAFVHVSTLTIMTQKFYWMSLYMYLHALKVFEIVVKAVLTAFKPDAVVLQCGCDTLAQDKLGRFNLTTRGVAMCLAKLQVTL